ncbi:MULTISPECIES: hypothetical protein [Stenotrophomonas]|uniref:hypothetical protein n=1 Tax=Stenotrophomonas TaxID=40323 RepID=UPI0021C62F99|nr:MULTISPECIES: hypothetical protein [Stenotrophomonas]
MQTNATVDLRPRQGEIGRVVQRDRALTGSASGHNGVPDVQLGTVICHDLKRLATVHTQAGSIDQRPSLNRVTGSDFGNLVVQITR